MTLTPQQGWRTLGPTQQHYATLQGRTRTLRLGGLSAQQCASLPDAEPQDSAQKGSLKGIADPVVPRLHLGLWSSQSASKRSAWYAILVLPLGDSKVVGLTDSLADTGLASGYIPVCRGAGGTKFVGGRRDMKTVVLRSRNKNSQCYGSRMASI